MVNPSGNLMDPRGSLALDDVIAGIELSIAALASMSDARALSLAGFWQPANKATRKSVEKTVRFCMSRQFWLEFNRLSRLSDKARREVHV